MPQGLRIASPSGIHLALADDHAVVRAGYRRLLESEEGLRVLAEYGDGEQAYADLVTRSGADAPSRVDLLILDLSMPGRGGMMTLQRLHQRLPELDVLVVSMHESEAMVTQALRAGARGYVCKSAPPEQLIEAVRTIRSGQCFLPEEYAHLMDKADAAPAQDGTLPHIRLSAKEFEIFRMLAAGDSTELIAERLFLSVKTVANYQSLIRRKTGLSNPVDMHRYASEHRLLNPQT